MKREDAVQGEKNVLAELMTHWRRRIRARDFKRMRARPDRKFSWPTQKEVALHSGCSIAWYRNLETGMRLGYSDRVLEGVAASLRLNECEREVMYREAVGRFPPPRRPGPVVIDEYWTQVLAQVRCPAYVINHHYEVVAQNSLGLQPPWDAFGTFPMRWILLAPEARHLLVDWWEDWAPPTVAQVKAALSAHPYCEHLKELHREFVSRGPKERALWNRKELLQWAPDGPAMRVRLPGGQGEVAVVFATLTSVRDPHLRLITLTPRPASSTG